MTEPGKSLNLAQVAELLGMDIDTVRQLADADQIPSYRTRRRYRRFREVDVLRAVAAVRPR